MYLDEEYVERSRFLRHAVSDNGSGDVSSRSSNVTLLKSAGKSAGSRVHQIGMVGASPEDVAGGVGSSILSEQKARF